jgi:hypothetical protein
MLIDTSDIIIILACAAGSILLILFINRDKLSCKDKIIEYNGIIETDKTKDPEFDKNIQLLIALNEPDLL